MDKEYYAEYMIRCLSVNKCSNKHTKAYDIYSMKEHDCHQNA